MKNIIREWLGIPTVEYRIKTLEKLLLHEGCSLNGFAVLKKHLSRPDKPPIHFEGKPIEQD